MPDNPRKAERVEVTFEHHGRSLSVAELQTGWRVAYGERVVIDAHLDRAVARALGVSPGSTLELVRRILSAPDSDPPAG